MPAPPRLLITAGPTQEPIDAVRFIGNRSSGRMGASLADAAAARGWPTTLLLGPTPVRPSSASVDIRPFVTTQDLADRLETTLPACDVLIMAAAVADYRPAADERDVTTKRRRTSDGMTLKLEPTPDLLAACSKQRRPGQLIVGYALEPRDSMLSSAKAKLERKGLDMIVANPLETMDSDVVEACVLAVEPSASDGVRTVGETGSPIPKRRFADWLLDVIATHRDELARVKPAEKRATHAGA